jgi:hypothetical protein
MNVNFYGGRFSGERSHFCVFCKNPFLRSVFFRCRFVRILDGPIQLQTLDQHLVNRGNTFMKRVLSIFAAVFLFAAVGAVSAAEPSGSQPATCQGPASQCNVFFGH